MTIQQDLAKLKLPNSGGSYKQAADGKLGLDKESVTEPSPGKTALAEKTETKGKRKATVSPPSTPASASTAPATAQGDK